MKGRKIGIFAIATIAVSVLGNGTMVYSII